MKDHHVQEGECLSSIAFHNGFHWQTLWDHPRNAELRQLRGDPFSLAPGDVVHVPDLEPARFQRSTGALHRFRRRGVPAKLRVRLLHADGSPRANEAYTLDVDGAEVSGEHRTDGDGWVDQFIAPDATLGTLVMTDSGDQYRLLLGRVRPIEELIGVQARLASLGFYRGALDGELSDETEGALQDFQVAYGLDPTGEIDDATREKLRAAFGG